MGGTSASTAIYRAAARILGNTLLASPVVRTICIRRSVAAGEAVFPFSDLDLAMVIDPVPGADVEQLRRRYRRARLAFPRLGECQVFTREDLDEFAVTDPYRASLDRRCAVTVFGPPLAIADAPISPLEASRRLVFWFEHFIPTARRQGNRRNLRKFAIEIANALGVLEGHWSVPLTSRRETLERSPLPAGDLFAVCLELAARAHALVRPPAPQLRAPLKLAGLVVAPSIGDAVAMPDARVMTPEVLDLLLHTQTPWLWTTFGGALAQAGFAAPNRAAWIAAARRFAGGERVRGPGFLEANTASAYTRLHASADVLGGERPPPPSTTTLSLTDYYLGEYDRLAAWAAHLRERARAERA